MSRRALRYEAPAGLILCIGDVDFIPFTGSRPLCCRQTHSRADGPFRSTIARSDSRNGAGSWRSHCRSAQQVSCRYSRSL